MANNIVKLSNFKKTWFYLRKNGVRQAYYAALERMKREKQLSYHFLSVSEEELGRQRKEYEESDSHRCYSILVPAYETDQGYLREMITSVLMQSYCGWELIVADASLSDKVKTVTREFRDSRIRYIRLAENGGISQNTNEALLHATGDYVGLLDHDDLLTPDALYVMNQSLEKAIREGKQPGLAYSDEDKMSMDAKKYYEPHLKPDFDRELLLSNNYICHFMVMEAELIKRLRLRSAYDGAQDYDFMLRACRALDFSRDKIIHIPLVLYHWRCHAGSTAQNPASKYYAYEAGRRALEDFMRTMGWKGQVNHSKHLGFYRIDYEPDLFAARPEVGVIGGSLVDKKGKIVGGMMDETGNVIYEGLHREFSGYMNRASMRQEAQAVDVRCIKVREELRKLFSECMGFEYEEGSDKTAICPWEKRRTEGGNTDKQWVDTSLRLCKMAKEAGYRILWEPGMKK